MSHAPQPINSVRLRRLNDRMKFGGTSVESAEAIERVTGIVKSRLDRKPVVVVSAMGKTTNQPAGDRRPRGLRPARRGATSN